MALVYKALESWDVIVLGSPVYFDTVSAQTKVVIDRYNCLAPFIKQPDGRWGIKKKNREVEEGSIHCSGRQLRPRVRHHTSDGEGVL